MVRSAIPGSEAVRSVRRRSNATYAVFRLVYAQAGLTADLELVGFTKARKRERAIAKVAEAEAFLPESEVDLHQYVAVPMRSLDPYYADGSKVKEVPGYLIP